MSERDEKNTSPTISLLFFLSLKIIFFLSPHVHVTVDNSVEPIQSRSEPFSLSLSLKHAAERTRVYSRKKKNLNKERHRQRWEQQLQTTPKTDEEEEQEEQQQPLLLLLRRLRLFSRASSEPHRSCDTTLARTSSRFVVGREENAQQRDRECPWQKERKDAMSRCCLLADADRFCFFFSSSCPKNKKTNE